MTWHMKIQTCIKKATMKETKKGDSPAWARVTGNPGEKGGGGSMMRK